MSAHRPHTTHQPTHRRLTQSLGLSLGFATLLSAAAGCADPPPMILVRGAADLDDSCIASASPATFIGTGRLDLSVNNSGYILFPNVENVSPSSSETGPAARSASGGAGGSATWGDLSGETNRILLTTASVSFNILTDGVPGAVTDLFSDFDLPVGAQVLDPNGGRTSVQVAVLNSQHVAALKQIVGAGQTVLIEVSVILKGTSSGDRDVESNTFVFPIEVCNTCLVDPTCINDGATTICNPGQDDRICTGTPATP
jgi:hypothetical protein